MTTMEKIADALGVTVGEAFTIEYRDGSTTKLVLTPESITYHNDRTLHFKMGIYEILTGEIKLIRKQFKPVKGEDFWYVGDDGDVYPTTLEYTANHTLCKVGNCYKTRREITPKEIQKWVDFYKSDEVIKW